MGVAKDVARSPEDVISTPLPGETLAMFYARSRESLSNRLSAGRALIDLILCIIITAGEYWAQQAHVTSENRGKQLRRAGFSLAEERYSAYFPSSIMLRGTLLNTISFLFSVFVYDR